MYLIPCHVPVVQGQVFDHAPQVITHFNVLYVPKIDRNQDHAFGLYEETGRQILSSVLMHDYPQQIKTQGLSAPITAQSGHDEIPNAIYGGTIGLHYGHFITECLSVLWYYRIHGSLSSKIVFHSSSSRDEILATPYACDFLRYCGITPDQIIIPQYPTIFQSLIIPRPALSEDAFCYGEFGDFCRAIGDTAMSEATLRLSSPIYLSRTGLSMGTVRIANEATVVDVLERAGVRTIQPESLTVADQIALFRSGQVVSGIIGSSFHNSIFSSGSRSIALSLHPGIRRTFPLMDAVSAAMVNYLHLQDLTNLGVGNGFFTNYNITQPEKVAYTLLREIDQKKSNVTRTTKPNFDKTPKQMPEAPFENIFEDLRAYRVKTMFGEYLAAYRSTGRVHSRLELEAEDVTPLIALIDHDDILLMAQCEHAPVLLILDEGLAAPMLPFRRQGNGAIIGLQSLPSGRFLSAAPTQFNQPAFCQVLLQQTWESFELVHVEAASFGGRFRSMLRIANLVGMRGEVPWEHRHTAGPLQRYVESRGSPTR